MSLLITLLLAAAFLLFVIAAWFVPEPLRSRLGWTGAACAMLAWLIMHVPG